MQPILVGTLIVGALYSLQAVAFVLVFRTTGAMNFAQGQMLAFGAYLYVFATPWLRSSIPLVAVATLGTGILGVLIHNLILRRVEGRPAWTLVVLLFGVGEILTALIQVIWGTSPRLASAPFGGRILHVVGGFRIQEADLIAIAVGLAAISFIYAMLRSTYMGTAMRACANNKLLAAYSGLRIGLITSSAWFLAGVLVGYAGVVLGTRTQISLNLTDQFLSAFPAVIIGGIESIGGAFLSSFALALIIEVTSYYEGSSAALPVAYVALLAMLVVRPSGLFGFAEQARL